MQQALELMCIIIGIKPEELSILSCEKGLRPLIIKEHHYGDYKGASLWSDVS